MAVVFCVIFLLFRAPVSEGLTFLDVLSNVDTVLLSCVVILLSLLLTNKFIQFIHLISEIVIVTLNSHIIGVFKKYLNSK